MKFIISHDVDHLFGRDHWFRDMIYPKLIVRSGLYWLTRKISLRQALLRCGSCFKREHNNIDALMNFDREHGVPSTFFFGMKQGLGMSYYPQEAKPVIEKVRNSGFDVGVHGIEYGNLRGIEKERETFINLMGFEPFGIRMHYVRFDENTFCFESDAGYAFDSSEFDKNACGTIKEPYKVGSLWEFPLTIMDGYLPQKTKEAKEETVKRIECSRSAGLKYVTVLFHDYQFNEAYADIRDWYKWLIEFIANSAEDCFISYSEAIKELECTL